MSENKVTPEISKYLSEMRKKGHRDNPRPREDFVAMGIKSGKTRRKKAEARRLKKQENE